MTNNIVVEPSMQDIRVLTARRAALGDKVHVVEVVPLEFRSLIPYYPIVLSKDSSSDRYLFVALLGFEPGENLLLDDDTWAVPYIPINIRRQPFNVIATAGTDARGESAQVPALSIDLDSPRVSKEEGEPLFDEQGQATAFLSEMSELMRGVVESTQRGRQLAERLDEEGLIEPLSIGFTLANGQKHSVGGLFSLNEKKFRQLSQETVLNMHNLGQLGSVYAMMASWGQIGGLLQRKNARLAVAASTQSDELELPDFPD